MIITLSNFQSHENSTFEIVPGVNGIVGVSGSGKSAILRALDWVVNNNPSGDDFISHWADTCIVTIRDGNWSVTRVKGKGINQYILNIIGKKTQVFEGFGRDVPEPIKAILNIQDFNMRFQHNPPFLMNESSGAVSRYLNKIAHLDIIDKATSNIEATLKKEKGQAEFEKQTVINTDEKLKRFVGLTDLEDDLIVVEQQTDSCEKLEYSIVSIRKLRDQVNESLAFWNEMNIVLMLQPEYIQAYDRNEEIKSKTKYYNELDKLQEDATVLMHELHSVESLIDVKDYVSKMVSLYEWITDQNFNRAALVRSIKAVNDLEQEIRVMEFSILGLKKVFGEAFPETCPLCGKGRGDI
jgi:exonuclease SbcC